MVLIPESTSLVLELAARGVERRQFSSARRFTRSVHTMIADGTATGVSVLDSPARHLSACDSPVPRLIDEKDVAMPSNRSDDLQAKTVRA